MTPVSTLGPLEQAIMSIIWQHHPRSLTVREVSDQLQSEKSLAYTTVSTIMTRLVKKGLLSQEKNGKTALFKPNQNQQQTLHSLVKQTLQKFIDHLVKKL